MGHTVWLYYCIAHPYFLFWFCIKRIWNIIEGPLRMYWDLNYNHGPWEFLLHAAIYIILPCMNSWSSFESNPSLIICVISIFLIWAQEIKIFDLLSEQFLIGYRPSNLTVIGGDLVFTVKKKFGRGGFQKVSQPK